MISFFLRTVLLPPCCRVSYPIVHGFVGLYRLCKMSGIHVQTLKTSIYFAIIWHLSPLFTIIPATYYVTDNFTAPGTKCVNYSQFSNF